MPVFVTFCLYAANDDLRANALLMLLRDGAMLWRAAAV